MTDKSQLPNSTLEQYKKFAQSLRDGHLFDEPVSWPPVSEQIHLAAETIDALRAAYEAQKAEIATLRGKGNLAWPCDKCGHCFEVCDHEKESAERRVAELEAALKKYGSHSNGCARVITFAATCTCGFDEAMSGEKDKP